MKSFREDLYDLLILDITMPQIDGFGLCEPMTSIENDVKVGFITTFEVNFQALRVVFPTSIATDDLGCFIRPQIGGRKKQSCSSLDLVTFHLEGVLEDA